MSTGARSWPTRRSTTTLSTEGVCSTAPSAIFLSGTTLPRRHAPSCVSTTLAPQSLMRSRSASELKPPKTTECGAPRRAHASMATTASGTMPM